MSFLFLGFVFCLAGCQVDSGADLQVAGQASASLEFEVSLPSGEWKKLNDSITLSLSFPYSLSVTGAPYVEAEIGTNVRQFRYESGSGTRTLLFTYQVSSQDLEEDGVRFDDEIKLNGGKILFGDGQNILQAPLDLRIPFRALKVDGKPPSLSSMQPPAGEVYITGQFITASYTFDEPVIVTGTPSVTLSLQSGDSSLNYAWGSGSRVLVFRRALTPADVSSYSLALGTSLNLSGAATVTDLAGNQISPTLLPFESDAISINPPIPVITGVSPPTNRTYAKGEALNFVATFDRPVLVTGTPYIIVRLSNASRRADYISGSGTTALTFRYTVQDGDNALSGISFTAPQNSGSKIRDTSDLHAANLILNPAPAPSVIVDAILGPEVIQTAMPTDGDYGPGSSLNFTLSFNRPVTITGSPRISLNLGGTSVYALYTTGSATSQINFSYTIASNIEDFDGISLSHELDLNGGSIRDAENRAAILIFSPPINVSGIRIDSRAPSITTQLNPQGNFRDGNDLNFKIGFSESVFVASGTPSFQFPLTQGSVLATYVSGSGSSELLFRYQIQTGDLDTSSSITPGTTIVTNGATIRDAFGNNASLNLPSTPITGLVIDADGPTISSVVPPSAGAYGLGEPINIEVNWEVSDPVAVSGTPYIDITVGETVRRANYNHLDSTNTKSIFTYLPVTGDLDSDGISVGTSIVLNSGSITDLYNNAASDLSFVPINTVAVLVDAIGPVADSLSVPVDGYHTEGDNLDFIVTWDGPVVITGTPRLSLTIGNTIKSAVYNPGLSTSTSSVFRYTVGSNDLDTNGITLSSDIQLGSASITDAANNPASRLITVPSLSAVLVDAVAPSPLSVVSPTSKTYRYNEVLSFRVRWSEPIDPASAIGTSLPLTIGATSRSATFVSLDSTNKEATYSYTIVKTDLDTDGIELANTTIQNGTVTDLAGNNASMTLPYYPNLAGVHVDGPASNIVNISAPIAGFYRQGDDLDFTVTFSETVTIVGLPYLVIQIGSVYRQATYTGTSGAQVTFRYTLITSDTDTDGVTAIFPINLPTGASIQDSGGNNAFLEFPNTTFPTVLVDSRSPVITSTRFVTSDLTPITTLKSGETSYLEVTYDEDVVITGAPRVEITVNGSGAIYAVYNSDLSSGDSVRFTFAPDAQALDLDGITLLTPIDLNGGSIQDAAGNDAGIGVTLATPINLYYSNIAAHYRFDDEGTEVEDCGANSCITLVRDLSGNEQHIDEVFAPGPILTDDFNTGNRQYGKFSTTTLMNLPNLEDIKYVVVILRTATMATDTHSLVSELNAPLLNYIGGEGDLDIVSDFYHKLIFNTLPQTEWTYEHIDRWRANEYQYLVMTLFDALSFTSASLGSVGFDGEVAEILFFTNQSTLSSAQLIEAQNQLDSYYLWTTPLPPP